MAKIALLATNLAGSGAEKVVLNLARMFERYGDEVHIFLLEDIVSYDTEGLNIHPLSKRRDIYKALKGIGDWLLALKLKRKMKQLLHHGGRFDLLLSHLPSADRVAVKADLPNTCYVIHTSYSLEIEEFKKKGKYSRANKKEKLYHTLYRKRDLIAVSYGIKDDLDAMSIAYGSCNVIYNPFDFEMIRKMAGEKSDIRVEGEYILCASAFRPVKRHDILLEAYSKLSDPPPLKLLCNPDSVLENMIRALGLEEKVEILGFTPNPYPVIKHARMLVLSSEREGLPTVLIEALILGTPVVSTDCRSGPSEILTGEQAKFLAKINNANDLAEKIDQMLHLHAKTEYKTEIDKFESSNIYHDYRKLIEKGR